MFEILDSELLINANQYHCHKNVDGHHYRFCHRDDDDEDDEKENEEGVQRQLQKGGQQYVWSLQCVNELSDKKNKQG